jgi:hypothetical protein
VLTYFVTLEASKRSTFHIQFIHNVYPQRLSRWKRLTQNFYGPTLSTNLSRWKRLLLFQNDIGMVRFFQNEKWTVEIAPEWKTKRVLTYFVPLEASRTILFGPLFPQRLSRWKRLTQNFYILTLSKNLSRWKRLLLFQNDKGMVRFF